MTKQNDGLFLLEVLVDKIFFIKSPCFSDKDFRTCINIACPGVEPLEICDDEPGACLVKSTGPFIKSFNNGKSCLFSLNENEINTAMNKYPINVCVYKALPCGCLPTKIVMGECVIDMTKEFVEARKTFLEDPTNVSYQALKDSFRIVGPDGSETGEIVMFLRISCFGKLIITRFQGPGGPPNLAAGKSSAIIDRSCTPTREYQSMQDPCACGAARGNINGGVGGSAGVPCNVDPYNSMPCTDLDDPCYCSGPKPQPKQQMVCRNTDQYCLHVPKDCCPTGNKVVFQLPTDTCDLGHKQRTHFKFTSDGVGDLARDEPGQLMSTTSEQYPGVVYDFPRQIIKMRIGKTIEMPGRKSKLEYQFITPVITHEKIVPVREERTAQCAQACNLQNLLLQQTKEDGELSSRKIKHIIYDLQVFSKQSFLSNSTNNVSVRKRISETHTDIFYNNVDRTWESWGSFKDVKEAGCFGVKDTSVYMSLSHNYGRMTLGTQATASINKSFQVCEEWKTSLKSETEATSNYCSTCSVSTVPLRKYKNRVTKNLLRPEIYFFGKKKERSDNKGMGSKGSYAKLHKTSQTSGTAIKSGSKSSIQSCSNQSIKRRSSSTAKPNFTAKNSKGAATASGTFKSVTIKDEKSQKPCPALGGTTKGDMTATVSHIKIGPKETCPVHGNDPCQGPKCVLASSGQEQGLVKVTNINNPRKGVFEIVIRKLTGAPLAKNELMLEWTPPPSRTSPCNVPCPISYIPPRSCRHSKCKLIVCRPTSCRPKCSRKKPCGQTSCRTLPCKSCCRATCYGSPYRPCKPCPPQPPSCCPVSPCSQCVKPCKTPCAIPCKSSPCLKPCPIGRKRPRISRSQPKIKSHRKKLSPCSNRAKACPVVRCRSIAGQCTVYCGIPQFCLPRNCSAVLPCKFTSLESCLKSCSSCCG
ncbi:uncharacterized protein LOC126780639 [Nymphalis io]|uniref:uncharacterized protein LOC126780639 n=1 Tax=Inachis io TaxID=171585 RepID=UPI0021677BCC|nr:uncharacterized protein LOC126780639 [Nymphalis io]